MRNYYRLEIWQYGMQIVEDVYEIVDLLPDKEKFVLQSQSCRSAISIPSNIAEGCSRSSEKDYKRFLEIALGSAFELETQLLIIQKIYLQSNKKMDEVLKLLKSEQKMITSLISKIKADNR